MVGALTFALGRGEGGFGVAHKIHNAPALKRQAWTPGYISELIN